MIAIDLGSNTLRCLEFDCHTKQIKGAFERMVKTAEHLSRSGIIAPQAVLRIIQSIEEAKTRLNFSQEIKAVTTAAMRMAKNRKEVLAQITKKTGVSFELIDAKKEAYYTQLAVFHRLSLLGKTFKNFALIDVGGGSTELIIGNGKSFDSMSVDVGIVTMSESYRDKASLGTALYEALVPMKDFIASKREAIDFLVSTAGTPTTMSALKMGMTVQSYDASRINGSVLSVADLDEGLEKLLAMDEASRALHVGVGRDALIVTGVEILKVIYELLGFSESIVIDDGLREGLAIDFCLQKR